MPRYETAHARSDRLASRIRSRRRLPREGAAKSLSIESVAGFLHQPVPRTTGAARRTKLLLCLEPVVTIVTIAAAACLPIFVRAVGDFLLEDEGELVPVEILEPLRPRDRAEASVTWKVEADTGAAVRHANSGGPGRCRLAGRGFRVVTFGPLPNQIVVPGGKRPQLGPGRLPVRGCGEPVRAREY